MIKTSDELSLSRREKRTNERKDERTGGPRAADKRKWRTAIKKKELRSFHVGGVEGYEYRARGMKLEKLHLCLSADGNCFCRESHRENRFPPFAHSTLAIRYYTGRLSDRAIETCAARITSLPFLATKTERPLRVRVLRIPSVR